MKPAGEWVDKFVKTYHGEIAWYPLCKDIIRAIRDEIRDEMARSIHSVDLTAEETDNDKILIECEVRRSDDNRD